MYNDLNFIACCFAIILFFLIIYNYYYKKNKKKYKNNFCYKIITKLPDIAYYFFN